MTRILVINGPNLNLLGTREPEIYGHQTLSDIIDSLRETAAANDIDLRDMQSNSEGALVDAVQQAAAAGVDYIILNPGAYTHTSVAMRDALTGVSIPFIEVHLSAVSAREPFRQISYFADIAEGVISGFQAEGYHLALQAFMSRIES